MKIQTGLPQAQKIKLLWFGFVTYLHGGEYQDICKQQSIRC